ncbi:MAG: hypothetical protein WDM85_00885 [Caulobacteraceae bacterium]
MADQGKWILASPDEALQALSGADLEHRLVVAGQTKAEIAAAEAQLAAMTERPTPARHQLVRFAWRLCRLARQRRIMQAMSGIAFSFGEAEGPPILPQGAAPQMLGGLTGFIAVSPACSTARGASSA